MVLAAAVSTVLVVGLGAAASSNYRTAVEWRDRFAAAAADVVALEDAVAARDEELERVSSGLEASEADVERLETRVAEFASEKARVEDEREAATVAAQRFAEISLAYDEVASQFDSCVAAQSTFTDMMINFELYWNTNRLYVVEEQAIRTGQICGSAQGMLRELRAYIDALAG